jgi:glycerol transport system ATP-binding protein
VTSPREVVLAVRAHHLSTVPQPQSAVLNGRVTLAEISGSETYLHVANEGWAVVAQLPGVQHWPLGSACTLHLDPAQVYCFDAHGQLVFAPCTSTRSSTRSSTRN